MNLKIGDLVEIEDNDLYLILNGKSFRLKDKIGILTKEVPSMTCENKFVWMVYIQELGIERRFSSIEFKKVKL